MIHSSFVWWAVPPAVSFCSSSSSLLLLFLMLLHILTSPVAAAFNLTILHVNDHHSHLEGGTFDVEFADLPLNLSQKYVTTTGVAQQAVSAVSVPYGGFARLKTLLDRYDDNNNNKGTTTQMNNVLKLHAGDALVGTPIYSIFQAEADAALMKQLCFDAFCLGNHVSICVLVAGWKWNHRLFGAPFLFIVIIILNPTAHHHHHIPGV
jgi:2',3'-cyclic-nucleotide 2'-phosphodiesterase (5'-nucleotidase family)